MQRKSLLILGIALVIVGFCAAGYWMSSSTSPSSSTVPGPAAVARHIVKDIWKYGAQNSRSVWLFIVVENRLGTGEAQKLIDYYESQYEAAWMLSIDMFCDDRYASHEFVQSRS